MNKRFLIILMLVVLTFTSAFDVEAKSKQVKKALHAYNKYLSAEKQKWGDWCKVSMSECEFALKDFDADGVPELMLFWPHASIAYSFQRVYTYKNGKVKELFDVYSGDIDGIYPARGLCVVTSMHADRCWEYIYKISKGKCNCILSRYGSDYEKGHEGEIYYNKFNKGDKKISRSKYRILKKKLIGNSKNKKGYKYIKNTKKNRQSILV